LEEILKRRRPNTTGDGISVNDLAARKGIKVELDLREPVLATELQTMIADGPG
jgi:hypothetical protein